MAIRLRVREEFADNRFQLLFIYIDIDTYIYSIILMYCHCKLQVLCSTAHMFQVKIMSHM